MRIGTVCFAIERGLGYLAKSFYDNGIITDVAVVLHGRIPDQLDWYPEHVRIATRPFCNPETQAFIRKMDVMLFFETPFDWDFIKYAKKVGVKTVLMLMYECTPSLITPENKPDLYLCPSLLDMEYFPNNSVFIPVPVGEPWILRTKAHTFVHNCGYIGLKGRSGTVELLKAVKYIQTPLTLKIRSQDTRLRGMVRAAGVEEDARIQVHVGTLPYADLRTGCDVAVCPEKFNGLSLPLQEARASGMLVMASDRHPANTWLPPEPLIPVCGYRKQRVGRRFLEFDEAQINSRQIASTMDAWYGQDITDYSVAGREWAKTMSWEVLKPKYLEVLEA